MKTIELPSKRVLYQAAERIRYVYFPIDAVISLVSVMENGASVEVGAVGHEGMLGVPLLLGYDTADTQARTQIAGAALRMRSEMFRAEVHQSEKFKASLLRYAHGLLTQVAQTAACNRLHSVSGRLARWLLIAADRAERNDLPFTHEFIAQMLGVRRAGITVAAGMLSDAGMIGYTRGHIHILDRRGLEASACECYEVVRNEFDLLMKPAA
ncbi:MAG: Crp/Fnr family transcriptional regulator [Pyrinomonadaceae bacterium]|nr:Crp/Fnr family transcriptional regulator [Pyrinomonadaceae bacterium]